MGATSTPTIAFLVMWIIACVVAGIITLAWGIAAACRWYDIGKVEAEERARQRARHG